MTQQRDMKTLPEILDEITIQEEADIYRNLFDKEIAEIVQAIAKELMGCLPENPFNTQEIQESFKDDPVYLRMQLDKWYGFEDALDEVRARLTAFIGEVEK